jgi:hypothetical protein
MIKKFLLITLACLSGPALVLITMLFYNWSTAGGVCTMAIVSFIAVKSVWQPKKEEKNNV